jgi:SAM-dependent methyltransferase
MTTFDPAQYWNNLSGSTMKLSDVGWPNWTEAYNAYRYRLSLEQISSVIDAAVTCNPRQILDMGCGIGFWTQYLLTRFPTSQYMGMDISKRAVANLQKRFEAEKHARFLQADISNTMLDCSADLIICLEVLLHVIDCAKWKSAIKNISLCLSQNGIALISDPISVYSPAPHYDTGSNCRVRHIHEWQEVLADNELEILEVVPRTFFLDNNFDFRSPLTNQAWRLFFRGFDKLLSVKSELLGSILGFTAYQFDKRYAVKGRIGHSCKLLVLKKK